MRIHPHAGHPATHPLPTSFPIYWGPLGGLLGEILSFSSLFINILFKSMERGKKALLLRSALAQVFCEALVVPYNAAFDHSRIMGIAAELLPEQIAN